MVEAAFWGALSAFSLVIGAMIALRWSIRPRLVGLVMAFGAGALISAISFDLVEEGIGAAAGSGAAALGLAAGALAFFAGDWAIDRRGGAQRKDVQGEGATGNPAAIMLGTVLDGIPESIVIGGSLVAGGGVSAAMVAAAFISNLPESLGASVGLKAAGTSSRRLMGMWLAIVAVSALSSAVGYAVLDSASPSAGAFFQTFAAGAMLTMLADTMIPEAHEEGGRYAGLCMVLGFALAVYISLSE
jgi:zinc transporter, ZIP family